MRLSEKITQKIWWFTISLSSRDLLGWWFPLKRSRKTDPAEHLVAKQGIHIPTLVLQELGKGQTWERISIE